MHLRRKEGQLLDANSCIDLELIHGHREWITERMYPCLFINTKSFKLVESGDFWLSETPEIPGSKSFKSAFPRLCTWALLSKNDVLFYVFNCHLDHILDSTRLEQSKVLCEQIKKINSTNLPIVLCGDFNESPQENVRSQIDSELSLQDTFTAEDEKSEGTHHRFDGNNTSTARIDWILKSDSI